MDKEVKSESGSPDGTDCPQSNHDHAMARFNSVGYEVRFLLVNPVDNGVPQSRPRILYQGICKARFPGMNCKLAMDNLAEEWARLQKGTDYGLCLDDFLLGDDDVPTEGDYDDDTEPKSKRAKTCKWETAHEEYKKMKQVPCPYHCNGQLVFFKFFQFMQIKMTLWSREP